MLPGKLNEEEKFIVFFLFLISLLYFVGGMAWHATEINSNLIYWEY